MMTMTTKMIMTPRPYRGRRPSYSQHRRDGGGYGGVYGGGGRDRGRGPQYYRFSFGSKEKAKTVGTGEGQVNFLGHRARFNRERIRNKDVEAGGQWGGVNLSPGAKVWLANYA